MRHRTPCPRDVVPDRAADASRPSAAAGLAGRIAVQARGMTTEGGQVPAAPDVLRRSGDILSIAEGRISAVWTVGDWLRALAPAGLVQVQTSSVSAGPTGAI
jgi:hypothetical protein